MTSPVPVRFAAVGLDHAHIFGQVAGLIEAGAEFVALATDDPDAAIAKTIRERYPDVEVADDPDELAGRDGIDLVVTAAVPDRRGPIALDALRNGKDVVADKPGCVSPRSARARSSRRWPRPAGSGRSPSPSGSRCRA